MTKKKDTTGNIIKMPLKPQPQAIHRAMAEEYKPVLMPLTPEESAVWDTLGGCPRMPTKS